MKIYSYPLYSIFLLLLPLLSCNSNSHKLDSDNIKEANENTNNKFERFDTIPPVKLEDKEDIKVVNTFPHDPSAFTQGLYYKDGLFYESTGNYGSSSLRKIKPETGDILEKQSVPARFFAEGLTIFNNKIYQLTWVNNVCFVYDASSMKKLTELEYSGEGWGIAHDDKYLIMSDGTNMIRFLDPATFRIVRTVAVTDSNNLPIHYLNELEYINGEIWANVWQSDRIVRIDPVNGKVNSTLDISLLWNYIKSGQNVDVLNGIAYDKEKNRIFLTGKYWPYVFEVKVNQ